MSNKRKPKRPKWKRVKPRKNAAAILRQNEQRLRRVRKMVRNGYPADVAVCFTKSRFACREQAEKVGERIGMRSYACTVCDGFHLTKRKSDQE